jgi:dipeptidase E
MKFYLSSYKVGNKSDELRKLSGKKLAYISNALDFSDDFERRKLSEEKDCADLKELGFSIEKIDLRNYFGKKDKLKDKLNLFDIVWVRGGNVFVLRQAMKLSGFDEIIPQIDIIYGGYSAGVCVLGPNLKGLEIVDDLTANPYKMDTVWEGLNLIDFVIVPHYNSDHEESDDVAKLVEFLKDHNIKFKALRDGEVIII